MLCLLLWKHLDPLIYSAQLFLLASSLEVLLDPCVLFSGVIFPEWDVTSVEYDRAQRKLRLKMMDTVTTELMDCSSVEACILPAPPQTSIQQLFHVWHSFFLSIPRASVLNIAVDEVAWQRWDAAGVHHNCPLLTFLLGAHGATAGSLLSLISDGTCCWCQIPPADLSSRFAKCWVEQCWSLDFWSQ